MENGKGGREKEKGGGLKAQGVGLRCGVGNPNLHETPDDGPDGDDGKTEEYG